MKTALVVFLLLLGGCSSIPSMRYCDEVSYVRKGSEIHINAVCQAPIGGI